MKVGYIGLGKLGLSCAEVLAEEHEVIGYDIVDRKSDKIKITTNIEDCFKDTKIIFTTRTRLRWQCACDSSTANEF
jgi:UDP-N-acetyl-D-mannosaminuronate dehydrogenase